MRTSISAVLLSAFWTLMLVPLTVSAETASSQVFAEILRAQGVGESAALDCARVSALDAERYGAVSFAASLNTSSKEYQTLIAALPPEKLSALYRDAGLQNLGCPVLQRQEESTIPPIGEHAVVTAVAMDIDKGVLPQTMVNIAPFRGGNMGFIATWTTIVWMFSALGFAVFMVWITSSKFRFQFRKMAEGEFDMSDKAMTILKERFARGEVTKEQFDKMRRDILN